MATTTTLNLVKDPLFRVSPFTGTGAPFSSYRATSEYKNPSGANVAPPSPLPNITLNAVYNGTDDYGLNYTFGAGELAASTQYTFSAYVYTQTGSITFRLQIVTTSGITEVELNHTDQFVSGANTWTRMTCTFTTPSDMATKGLVLRTILMSSINYASRLRTQGWQLEQRATATPICEGNLAACSWTGAQYYSTSTRTITTDIIGLGNSDSTGNAVMIIVGVPLDVPETQGFSTSYGSIDGDVVAIPDRSFDDFAHGLNGGHDPRMTTIPANTVSISTTTTAWVRNWIRQTVPLEYPIPGGYAWKRATYAAVGVKWPALANNAGQYIDLIQLEKRSGTAPTAWDSARAVVVKVKPERVNYISNPSLEINTTGWSSVGSNTPTLSQNSTFFKYGTKSLKVTLAANPPAWSFLPWQGAGINISGLTDGETYVASAWVYREVGCPAVFTVISGQGYGSGTGSAYTGVWERISIQFKKLPSTTATFQVVFDQDTMHAGQAATFYVDGIMCERLSVSRNDYFDGSFPGQDYLWDSAGTPHLTKSYYYSGRREKQYRLESVIKENVPLGIQVRIQYTDTM